LSNSLSQTHSDIRNINQLATRPDILDLLASSIAPSIYGHEYVKRAFLLLLLGGTEKTLDSGIRIRGDIHVLLVGEPGIAKSQLLESLRRIVPSAITTTGCGAVNVGLTAAETCDTTNATRAVEIGPMAMADKGMVCIDQFNEMRKGDHAGVCEAMEQQTVTLAGTYITLNARCSVAATAAPIHGYVGQILFI
jgi:DNA replication licensing factor MCM3